MADEPVQTLWVDSRVHSMDPNHNTWAITDDILIDGVEYLVKVDGNHTVWDGGKGDGLNIPIKYPSPGNRVNWSAFDYDTKYADEGSMGAPGHSAGFLFNRGDGWYHPEPQGGPYSYPQAGNAYEFIIVGLGQKLRAAITDTPLSDNSGMYRIQFYGELKGGWQVGSLGFG